MTGPKHLWKGSDTKAIERMKKLFEIENMMFRKQLATDGLGFQPMRLLREDIERIRTAKERERGWVNSYKGNSHPRIPFGYMDKQLALSDKILGHERESPQTFLASLNNSKGNVDAKTQVRERGWTSSTYKEPRVNESLFGLSKPYPNSQQHNDSPTFKLLQEKKMENAKKLETGWVSFGREQGKRRTGSGGTVGRPRGLTSAELQSLQKMRTEKQERASTTGGGGTERSAVSSSTKNMRSSVSADGQSQREKYYSHLVVPIGTLDRSGFGTPRYRASIAPEGQRDKYNQLLESGWVHRHDTAQQQHPQASESCQEKSRSTEEDILKQGIQEEEQAGWISSYKRKQKREMYGLAKERDKTASEVLRESYDRYRERGWINPLQRQKQGTFGLGGSGSKIGQMAGELTKNA